MRVLFDANILLDVLLEREPHVEVAEKLVALVDNRRIEGFICATAATTLHYVGAKALGQRAVHEHLRTLLGVFEVAAVDRDVLQRALDANGFTDYEDAVVHEAAHSAGCNAIVTRDATGFVKATMPVFQPLELLAAVAARAD
ncbi:MAG: PIN domain-containing protein [Coriobacteriia bacterium]|nr:PIN domain-containing protein [Coriobacteriia bacterium]MBW6469458.1 PIN domain-containing protein [Coriobacteriia bacterium]